MILRSNSSHLSTNSTFGSCIPYLLFYFLDSRTVLQIMDQKLIFVAMMLLILPFLAASGKNIYFLKSVSVSFNRDTFFGRRG